MKKLGKFELDKIYLGDCRDLTKQLPDNSIDLIVTDPPYGIAFMGKDWDTFEPQGAYQYKKGFRQLPRHSINAMMEFFVPIWKEGLRILKSGGFAFVMCSPRQDVLMTQIQTLSEAGFNTGFTSIYWTYASGFPKASNIAKMVDKRLGTVKYGKTKKGAGKNPKGLKFDKQRQSGGHLKSEYKEQILTSPQAKSLNGSYAGFQPKPAVEVIIVAMKPLSEKTYVDQALKNRKGITWLDDGKIPYESEKDLKNGTKLRDNKVPQTIYGNGKGIPPKPCSSDIKGRFPANLLVSDDVLNDGKNYKTGGKYGYGNKRLFNFNESERWYKQEVSRGDSGSFSRYFDLDKWFVSKGVKDTFPFLIVPKASKSEKNRGCENLPLGKPPASGRSKPAKGRQLPLGKPRANFHPTVKPIKLMSYLIMLGSRKGDIILDPFIGSGTTAIACKILNRKYLGFEISKEYIEIANARLKAIKHIQEKLL